MPVEAAEIVPELLMPPAKLETLTEMPLSPAVIVPELTMPLETALLPATAIPSPVLPAVIVPELLIVPPMLPLSMLMPA
jgi:hypothetical protein